MWLALKIANSAIPESVKTASQSLADPTAPKAIKMPVIVMASMVFCQTMG